MIFKKWRLSPRGVGRTGQVYGDGNKFLNVGLYVPGHTALYSTRQYPSHPAMRDSQISQAGYTRPFLDNRQHTANSLTVLTKWKAHKATVSSNVICYSTMLTHLSLHHCWLLLPLTWQNVIHRAFISDNTSADLVVSMRYAPSALIFKNYSVRPRRKV